MPENHHRNAQHTKLCASILIWISKKTKFIGNLNKNLILNCLTKCQKLFIESLVKNILALSSKIHIDQFPI